MTDTPNMSFNPDDASQGGFLNDIDATIVKAQVVAFDYKGKSEVEECCLAVTYRPFDAEDDDDQSVDYIKLGHMTEIVPSPDGKRAVPITKTKFHVKSKIMAYFRALVEAGFPKNKIGLDVSVLEGLHVHLVTLAVPGEGSDKSGNKIKDSKLTIVSKILEKGPDGKVAKAPAAPGKKQGAATTAPATTTAEPAAAAPVVANVEEQAALTVLAIITDKGGKAPKSALPGEIFRRIKTDTPLRNAVLKIANNEEWLGSGDRPWKFEGGELIG